MLKLRIFDYSDPVAFPTDFSFEQAINRLSASIEEPTVFIALTSLVQKPTIVGTVGEDRVMIRIVRPYIRNSFKPYFFGKFTKRNGQTVLEGKFTMHTVVKILMTIWLAFLLLFFSAMVLTAIFDESQRAEVFKGSLVSLSIGAFGCLLTFFGRRLCTNDIGLISDRIKDALKQPSHKG